MENKDKHIAQELKELGIELEHKPGMPFTVPAGYFDKLPADTVQLIKALDYIEELPKSMPQEVPADFFEKMQHQVLGEVSAIEFEKAMPKAMPQEVPVGFFETSKASILASIQEEEVTNATPTLIVTPSHKKRSWALAATMALLVTLGLFFVNTASNNLDIENELSKVSIEEIDSYINSHDYDFEAYDILENPQLTSQSMTTLEEEILLETENMSNEEIFEYVL